MKDIRWQQRFKNFDKALTQLNKFLKQDELNDLEAQGLIQSFEYTHELAWKTQMDFLKSRGVTQLFGSKDTARQAFKLGIIDDGEVWLDMIESRNLTSHTYNEITAQQIIKRIKEAYQFEFDNLFKKLNILAKQENEE